MASRQILGQLLILFFILFSQRVTVFCDEEDDTEPEGTSNPILNESEKEKEIVVKPGERVEIECTIQDRGGLPLLWKKEDKVIAMSSFITNDEDKKYYSIDGDKLIILQVDKSLLGTYVCSATDVYQNHHISFPSAPTTVKIWPANLTFKKKNKVELECESDGAPKPSIEWKINNEKLPSGMKAHGNKLVISSASEKYNDAEITCIAKNEFGSGKDTKKLNVKYGPILTDPKTENIQVAVGKNTSFSCEHIANPHAKIIWHFNGTKVEGKDNKVTLDLKNVKPFQEGLYECHLTNELENVIKKFQLKILSQANEAHSTMNYQQTDEGSSVGGQAAISVKEEEEQVSSHDKPNSSSLLRSSSLLPLFIIFLIISIL